jgi:hypothetical protein
MRGNFSFFFEKFFKKGKEDLTTEDTEFHGDLREGKGGNT